MLILDKGDGEFEIGVLEFDSDTGRTRGAVRRINHCKSSLIESDLTHSVGIKFNSRFDDNHFVCSYELECGCLFAIVVDSDTNGTNPCVVDTTRVWNKESVHLKLTVADDVESGVVLSLEGVAEKTAFRKTNAKVWVRTNAYIFSVVCSVRCNSNQGKGTRQERERGGGVRA